MEIPILFTSRIIFQILDYLRLCLWYSAGIRSNPNTLKHAAKLNAYIRSNYESNDDNFIQKYSMLVKNILIAKRGNVELMCIYDLLNAELESLTKQCFDLMESFALALKDVSEYTRILVAQSVGILWAIGSSITEFNGYVRIFVFLIASEFRFMFRLLSDKQYDFHATTKTNRTSAWFAFGPFTCTAS